MFYLQPHGQTVGHQHTLFVSFGYTEEYDYETDICHDHRRGLIAVAVPFGGAY